METGFACQMNALDEQQRENYDRIRQTLKSARRELREFDDGYGFRFKAESQLIQVAAEFIVYERLCCPFFDFELSVENASGFGCAFAGRKALKNLFGANLISSSEKFCVRR